MSIKETIQSLAPGDLVELFILDATVLGGPAYHFTNSVNNGAPVVFNGVTFTPIDMESEGWEWNGEGSLPRPKLRISNATRAIGAVIITFQDLLGAKVTRIRTFRQFLDGETEADPEATFPIDVYLINQKTAHNKIFVEWELAAAMDQQGRQLPGRQCLRNACTHFYRVWDAQAGDWDYSKATCPFVDERYYDTQGEVAVGPQLDRCGKRLSDCRLRFGANNTLPFRGFPGMGRGF